MTGRVEAFAQIFAEVVFQIHSPWIAKIFVNRFVLGSSRFLGLGYNGLSSHKIDFKWKIVPEMLCAG